MPIEYRVNTDFNLVVTRATGTLDLSQFVAHIERMDADPAAQACWGELVDLLAVEKLDFSYAVVKAAIASSRENAHLWPDGFRVAVVTNHNLVYAAARMYEMLSSGVTWELNVFRERNEAEAWLGMDSD